MHPSMAQEEFSIVLPIELDNGNTGRTKHFSQASKRRKQYEGVLRRMGLVKEPPAYQQHVTITRILGRGQRYYDLDSLCRGNAKELLDAMTACGWWKDDSYKWLTGVDFRQDANRRTLGPAIEVHVRPAR